MATATIVRESEIRAFPTSLPSLLFPLRRAPEPRDRSESNVVSIQGFGFKEPRQLRFLLLEQPRARDDVVAMVLERSRGLCLLIVGQPEPLDDSGIGPPCSGEL